jgi:ABC-type phosphate transport system ATPase subunit
MVFQKPNPFPKTIFENVAYGLENGITDKKWNWRACCYDNRASGTLGGEG